MSAAEEERPSGLADVRTDLAWSRNGAAVIAAAAAVVKRATTTHGTLAGTVTISAVLAALGASLVLTLLHSRATTRSAAPGAGPVVLRTISYGTAALGAVALALAFTG
jgi:hypothetical protein